MLKEVDMNIIYELGAHQITQLHTFYQQEWWTNKRSLEETKKVVTNSSIVIGLIDNNSNLKAFARVLTDYTFKAIIFDVIVDKSFRNKGLGKELMNLIIGHNKLKDVKHFELYCLPKMVEFYKAYGFNDELGELVFMRKET
jgi:predicted GNAT family N-acyltransferase